MAKDNSKPGPAGEKKAATFIPLTRSKETQATTPGAHHQSNHPALENKSKVEPRVAPTVQPAPAKAADQTDK